MVRKRWIGFGLTGLMALLLFAFLAGCSHMGTAAPEAKPKTSFQVVSSAKVTKVDYAIKKYKGKNRLHVMVEIQNLAKVPKRFRVNIWLPNGVSGGGFYPRKKKAIAPGAKLSRTFPMYYDQMPREVTILVKDLPTD